MANGIEIFVSESSLSNNSLLDQMSHGIKLNMAKTALQNTNVQFHTFCFGKTICCQSNALI